MTVEELKKLDRRVREIPYPFGENFPEFRKLFADAALQLNTSVSEIIRQYAEWKYSKK